MARRRNNYTDNGSVGYNQDALEALVRGTYGKDKETSRKPRSMSSAEQVNIANPIPSLAGMKPINDEWQSSFSKARQYQQNIENEAKKFQYNDAIAAKNTLDKKDQNYIDGLVSRLGNPDSVRKYLGDKKGAEWEQKYGKTIDQIYDDYIADQDNAKMREGKEHSIRSTLAATLGEFGKPLQAIPHLVSNLIDPDSAIAKGSEKARAEYSDQLKRLKAGVKENFGDTGDKVYDTATQIGSRMLLNTAGNVLGGPLGAGLLTGLADYSDQMDALNLRPDISGRRKAATALTHGAIEGAGNAITRGMLDGLPTAKGALGSVINVGKGAGNAAIENSISEAIEMGADTLINGENSERELNKAIYMMQGMSEDEAENQVQQDQWDRVKLAAGTGALFGGFTKGLGEIADSAKKIPALKGLFGDTEIEETKAPVENAKPKSSGDPDRVPEGWTAEDLENSVENAPKVKNKAKAKSSDTFEYVTTDGKYTITPTDNGWEIKGTDGTYSKVNGGFDKAKSQLDNIYKMAGSETIPDVMPQKSSPEEPSNIIPFPGNKGQNRAEPTPNEPLPVDDSGIVPPDGNVPPEGGDKIRSFSKRGSQDETLPDEIRNTLSEDYYRVVHNADVEARADSLFVPENLTQTRSNLDRAVQSHDPASALLSYKLAKAYVDNGDYDAATDVLENVSAELTRMGQFTQAAKLAMLQNDPMAAMRSYMRDLEKLNEWGSKKYKGKWQKLELSKEDIDAISKIQKGDKDALNAITDQLNEKFAKQIPANLWDKAVALSKTNMLLNLRTQGRNIIANKAMLPVRSMADRVSAVGQNIAHLINPDIKVTQSLVGGTKEQKGIAEQIFNSMKESILGENKMKDSVKSDILSQRQIFNDDFLGRFIDSKTNGGLERLNQKLGGNANKSTLETLQNFTYWLMGDFGDTPYVKQNFVNRLASYMKAQGINKIEDVPDDAIAIATEEALKATFKDDNAFSKALMGTKQKWGKFGEIALPFVKTPANLAMRAIDFSPAGLINTIRKARNGADASRVIDELAKNLTGTAMIYLGYKLREKGLLSGNYSENDNEKAWQKQHGMLENALHVGNNYYTIDWAQPTVTPMILGSVLYDAISNSDKENADVLSGLNSAYKAGISVADSWLQTSPLQSLTDILGGNSYSGQSVAENIANEVIEFPQRFLPAQMGAAARTIDPVIRDTYSKDMSLTGILGNQARSAIAKIPGLSDNLPASYDTWGNERTRSDTTGEAFFAQNLNPGQLGNNNPTPLDGEIQRIYNATGNSAVFPLNADRSLDLGKDGKITLTNKQHSDYQRIMGQRSYSYAESIMNSAGFKNLSDDEKATVLGKAFKLSNDLTKEELFNHVTDSDKNLKEVARSGNANAVAKYLLDKVKADSLGMSVDKYQKMESEAPGSAEQWLADKENALNMGFTKKDGTVNMDSYEKAKEIVGDDPNALAAYSDYAKQGFTKNAEKIYYLENNPAFTNEQKGQMLTSFKEDGTINGQTAQSVYDMSGFEGMYYYYLLKNNAESNGKSGINKKERAAYFASDAPELDELWNYNQDLYYFLMNNIK